MQFKMAHPAGDIIHPPRPHSKQPVARLGHSQGAKKPRHPISQPVDADDLRRRLYIVISKREVAKEKKRQSRTDEIARKAREDAEEATALQKVTDGEAQKAGDSLPGVLETSQRSNDTKPKAELAGKAPKGPESAKRLSTPYIPQQAALQFTRTASVHVTRDKNRIHALSHDALRLHTESLSLDTSRGPAGQTRALRKVRSDREKLRDRNQFQNSRALEESREVEAARKSKKRNTIPNENMGDIMGAKRSSMRRSLQWDERDRLRIAETDENLPEDEVVPATTAINLNAHRMVDWTQSDENDEKSHGLRSPLLKRADSLWGLKEKFGRHGQDRDTTLDLTEKVDAIVPKPVKSGLWTKLRRHVAAVHA